MPLDDYCYALWIEYDITAAQFYTLNPASGTDPTGADCSLWLSKTPFIPDSLIGYP